MSVIPPESSKILEIYLLLAQYPMLASSIRRRMREELFQRGIISPERFEQEIREKAIESQKREGLGDEQRPEDSERWELRYHRIRRILTDFYFAYNLPIELLHKIVDDVLADRGGERPPVGSEISLRFNPELAPLEMVLRQAEAYESLPPEQRAQVQHHLEELRVVLLKSLLSDQLGFIRIAKRWFTAADFSYIIRHRIGSGKIGGKAAGMLLAYKILQATVPQLAERITLPRSYFIGADVFYDFLALNDLEYVNQKYKSDEQIRQDYPLIQEKYAGGRFPEEIADQLRDLLREVGNTPLIVRSSSLLEDNFGASFAGKYLSVFCPNQGSLKENLRDLTLAIRRAYASIYNPDALSYRRRMGLIDYDERMAILIQEVQGQPYRGKYFPSAAGVAYSFSPIVWNPRLRREEGFARLVVGLGTRAVERTPNDYPRLIGLSHPNLRPEVTPQAIRQYSQHQMDVIDLQSNALVTLPVQEVLGTDFPALRWVISVDDGETIRPPLTLGLSLQPSQFVVTFERLLQTDFVPLLRNILSRLAEEYHSAVDVEFALTIQPGEGGKPDLKFHLLQCRPHHSWNADLAVRLPEGVRDEDVIFVSNRMVPLGVVEGVEYIVFVDPEKYYRLPSAHDFSETARRIAQINRALEGKNFVLIGPGRWGSTDFMQGVPVTYADIFNTRALIELTSRKGGYASEPSYGTHFFQDLVESGIFPLAVSAEEEDDYLNLAFLRRATDQRSVWIEENSAALECIKVIHLPAERPAHRLEIRMDGKKGMGYLRPAE
ncbi:phosphoenolpyruvate synthase/pyruvate phosphate dikinase [Bellilinea caldifistulae]|uniref:PEP/pyruvate-binding domain-containing protein n=1 Tax=Bellilinea caldifistulae TaxID=360411 RepID=UPI000780B4BC|nr:PEP/pyruvate-binding domain-containing protein [Bellilinea caldifistulae]GAP08932.1 phosphoenolpyruvate synthase/pyruvate phosphate dikinase [Bellilinea caldifistulae]